MGPSEEEEKIFMVVSVKNAAIPVSKIGDHAEDFVLTRWRCAALFEY